MQELEKKILMECRTAVSQALKTNLTGYNSSFQKIVNEVVDNNRKQLKSIVQESFSKTIQSDEFSESVDNAFKHKLAKILVSKLEGSVEKAVNTLRSDPTIRAKMVLAIENIIKEGNE